jgi:hypothetical protein
VHDAARNPVGDTTLPVQVRLFDSFEGGAELCRGEATGADHGHFTVLLPAACTAAVHANPAVFVQVIVDSTLLGRSSSNRFVQGTGDDAVLPARLANTQSAGWANRGGSRARAWRGCTPLVGAWGPASASDNQHSYYELVALMRLVTWRLHDRVPPPWRAQAAARSSRAGRAGIVRGGWGAPRPSTSEHGAEPDAGGRRAARRPRPDVSACGRPFAAERGRWGHRLLRCNLARRRDGSGGQALPKASASRRDRVSSRGLLKAD